MRFIDAMVRALIAISFAAYVAIVAVPARAQLFINEIYFDPPGQSDPNTEYIELRGTPGMSLANHYLILIENEDNLTHTGTAGDVESIFNLGSFSIGSNGFLTIRQNGSPFAPAEPGTTDLVNSGGEGYGQAGSSTVGASFNGTGVTENSGFTAMLIRNNGDALFNQPFLGQDLDRGNNGLDPIGSDHFGWRSAWSILDSIGIASEFGESRGRLYGKINFGPDASIAVEPDAVYVGVGYEIEYAGRWGNSIGQTAADWHVSNLTDNPGSGFDGPVDFRQSGDPHPFAFGDPLPAGQIVETNQLVPYGTQLVNTLGAPNLLLGDFNRDGYLTGADIQPMLKALTNLSDYKLANGFEDIDVVARGDFNHDLVFTNLDIQGLLNALASVGEGSVSAVPEPNSLISLAIGGAFCLLAHLVIGQLPTQRNG
jgi:hypothetical protein